MRNPIIATLVAVAFIVSSCGRMDLSGPSKGQASATMSSNDAMQNLIELPLAQDGTAISGNSSDLSGEELVQLIREHQNSGHQASQRAMNLSGLTQMLGLIQGGATTVPALANGMVANSGSPSKASSVLTTILSVVNMLLPILMFVAPQYVPILQAIIAIVPVIVNFIQSVFSPTPTPVPVH